MFEYLMPRLLVRSEAGTLLAESERAAIERAATLRPTLGTTLGHVGIRVVRDRHRPWRTSTRSFGVPRLACAAGWRQRRWSRPMPSVLALPDRRRGGAGEHPSTRRARAASASYGFYEAADFTPARQAGSTVRPRVRRIMAHHQGMSPRGARQRAVRRRTRATHRSRSPSCVPWRSCCTNACPLTCRRKLPPPTRPNHDARPLARSPGSSRGHP